MLLGVSDNAIRLEPAFADSQEVRELIEGAGPFIPLAQTAQTKDEEEASGRAAVDCTVGRRGVACANGVSACGVAASRRHRPES